MEILKLTLSLFFKYAYAEKHALVIFFYGNNIWLLLLLLLAIAVYSYVYVLLLKHKKHCDKIASIDYEVAIFEYIDYRYYTKNIYITLFKLLIFFICTVFCYVMLRLKMLGRTDSLLQINLYNYLTIKNCIILIIFLIFIAIVRLYLDKILYAEVLRTHLYFCNYYNKYLMDWKSFAARPGFFINSIFSAIYYRFYYINNVNTRNNIEYLLKDGMLKKEYLKYTRRIYKLIAKKKVLVYIFRKIGQIFSWLDAHIKEIIYETGWLLILVALVYDITQQYLYYTYYALFLYTIRIFYRKFYEFYHGIDWSKDNYLHKYMYETPYFPHVYENIKRAEELENQVVLTEEQKIEYDGIGMSAFAQRDILETAEMGKYIVSDLKLWEFPYYLENKPYYIRKIILIILTIIGYMYIYSKTNIQIIVPHVFIIVPLECVLSINIIIQVYFWYIYNKSNIIKIIFWILSYTQCILIFIIFVNHHIPLMSTEVLFDFGIKIIDNYSNSEKVAYLFEYGKYVLPSYKLSLDEQGYLLGVLRQLPYNQLITDKLTFVDIQEYVKNIIEHFIVLESYYKQGPISNIIENNNTFIQFLENTIIIFWVTPKLILLIQILNTTTELVYNFPEVCYKILKSFR